MSREQRRLAAIVSADVVGYSRLMGRDESGTLASLRAHRKERFEPALARHGGRLVKLTGDGALAEFPSAVDALGAAIEFQQAMAEANRDQPEDTRIVFRIGLHLGDLIVEGDDLYGDGVNVAARLEAQAPAGGIMLSGNVHDAVVGRLKATFEDLGDISLKNIERPVRAYRVLAEGVAASPASTASSPTDAPLALPDKPSIAVLPFTNMSGDPEQEYFTDGVTEDIITELSRFRSLFVIARNSSFSYKGKSPDIRQVGRELGVRYVLEGSIRKSANRIRVTGQLIDTLDGSHIWAERYDRKLDDVFAVQEEVTRAIVAAIAPQISSSELAKAARRRPGNLSAYEIALRAWAHAWEGNSKLDRALLDQSIREAEEALAIDSSSVLALQARSIAHQFAVHLHLVADREHAFRESMSSITRAIELDGADPLGYALRATAIWTNRRVDRYPDALADARRAYDINPNDTIVLFFLAYLEALAGDPERAIEHARRSLRLSPRHYLIHETYALLAYTSFAARRYADGIEWASRAINDAPMKPGPRAVLANCLVGAGEVDRARAIYAEGRRLMPGFFEALLARWEAPPDHAGRDFQKRSYVFGRVAAGLDEPSAAEALR